MNTPTKELGNAGEQAAVDFLVTKGFIIRERNWKLNHLEVDIIAEKNGVFHFVEVKTRAYKSNKYNPVYAVNLTKQRNIINAARGYCQYYQYKDWGTQFDVIIVYGTAGNFEVEYMPKFFSTRPQRSYNSYSTMARRYFPKGRTNKK